MPKYVVRLENKGTRMVTKETLSGPTSRGGLMRKPFSKGSEREKKRDLDRRRRDSGKCNP